MIDRVIKECERKIQRAINQELNYEDAKLYTGHRVPVVLLLCLLFTIVA